MKHVRRPILLLVLLCCLSGMPARADNLPPVPERKTGGLENLKSQLEEKQQDRAALQSKLANAQNSLESIKKQLVESAKKARAGENALEALETRIAALTAEETGLQTRLQRDYNSMAGLIVALERIRRVPPEALIVRPGAPLETAQAAMLLRDVLPALNKRAAEINTNMKRLKEIRVTLEEDRRRTLEAKAETDRKYAEIQELAAKREKLYKTLNSDYERTATAVANISRQAQSMQDLLSRIDEHKKSGGYKMTSSSARAWALPKPGRPELPVPGTILTGFGATDAIGAVSQGLTVQSRAGAVVVAPMGGIIRFAGRFKDYGNMVILEHEKGYHSLVAGMENVTAAIGQSVSAGEPIGKLPSASSRGGPPTLYYELRYQGRAVNPSRKFSGLKS